MFGIFKKLFGRGKKGEIKELINNGAFLVDVRTPQEFKEGNVNGSTNIPLDQVGNLINMFQDKKHIIVFCRSGMRSGQAKSILEKNGLTNVTNGGTWQNINQILNNK